MSVSGQTKRINEQLKQYWHECRANHAFPLESDINPDEIAAIWDYCFLVRVDYEQAKPSYQYVYLGESLVSAYGDELGSKEICERLAYPAAMHLSDKFAEVVRTATPVDEESEFTNQSGMVVKFRSCLLPLGYEDYSKVGYIIGGMKWKAV